MQINTFAIPLDVPDAQTYIRSRCVIVIDVLRATSVVATALHAGAKRIIPVSDISDALSIQNQLNDPMVLLCGERKGLPIEGFHMGNSPLEFTPEKVAGRTLIMTTTNGTRAFRSADGARLALSASLLNLSAAARAALASGLDITILCAGTRQFFTLDDVYTAGALIHELGGTCDDLSALTVDLYNRFENDPHGALSNCKHYCYLQSIGMQEDLDFCLRRDAFDVAPVYRENSITL